MLNEALAHIYTQNRYTLTRKVVEFEETGRVQDPNDLVNKELVKTKNIITEKRVFSSVVSWT